MSPDVTTRTLGMFPLSTVFYPFGLLPLHVFEERYQTLMSDCIDGDGEFGVVLIARGSEVGGGDQRVDESEGGERQGDEVVADGPAKVFAHGTQRCAGEVELYKWIITFLAPTRDSTVRSIKSSRAGTRTCNHTSSGAWPFSISRRLKSNSVLDAEGNPTSISLNPILTRVWNNSSFWETFMGTARA